VADTGEGMDEATLARASEPFFTTNGVGKGTGLGLAMVHGVAEQSGGRLILKSRKGEGTTAELWLPASKIDFEAVRQNKQPAAPEPAPVTDPLVVLAIDDDHLVLTNTAAMLEDFGHSVFKASGGQQALHILRENAVDLVITDQAMPDITGVQVAEAIRAEWPRVPVILATGYAEAPPGPGAHLPRLAKPFGQAALSRAIADVVGKQQK
jgi:CheY-like chemotaxis protein